MTFSKNFVKTLTLKKSNLYCAKKLGISEEEYVAMKRKYRENKNDKFVTIKENKIIEFSENVNEGTANIKGFSITEPKSAEEIESILKIDKTKWSLSSYWNKQHKNSKQEDYWIISAMVVKKKENDIVFENLESILSDIFKDKKPFVKEKNVKITNNKYGFLGEILKDRTGKSFIKYQSVINLSNKSNENSLDTSITSSISSISGTGIGIGYILLPEITG
jgi:hypothetical protein